MINGYFLWFGYWTLKEQNTVKVLNHFVSAYYLHRWLVHLQLDVNCCHVHFSWEDFELCASLEQHPISFDKLAHLDWHFMEVDQHTYRTGWEWWMQADWAPCYQKCCWKWNWSFFQDVPPNRLVIYMGSLAYIIRSLLSHFCLFQNAILLKVLKLGFLNFKPVFLRMQFSLFATIFLYFWLASLAVSWVFMIYNINIYRDKSITVLGLYIWN